MVSSLLSWLVLATPVVCKAAVLSVVRIACTLWVISGLSLICKGTVHLAIATTLVSVALLVARPRIVVTVISVVGVAFPRAICLPLFTLAVTEVVA